MQQHQSGNQQKGTQFGLDTIATRTRLKTQNEAEHPPNTVVAQVCIDSLCSIEIEQRQKLTSGILKDWQICEICAFSPHPYNSQSIQENINPRNGNEQNKNICAHHFKLKNIGPPTSPQIIRKWGNFGSPRTSS
jgi:abortive infection bacteriophage resistance protein